MPTITVFPDVPRAYNRVDIDWSDTPGVEYARVLRVDVVTGECVPLRPYICFSGDYLNVSCDGHGVFWDTEVPLDRSVYYITEGLDAPCEPTAQAFFDTFTRVSVNQWGTSTSGTPWAVNGGVAADYQVNGTQGTMGTSAASQIRRAIADVGSGNVVIEGVYYPQEIATGAPFYARLGGRADATGAVDGYEAMVSFTTIPSLELSIIETVAGVTTTIGPAVGIAGSYVPGSQIHIKMSISGARILAKAWNVSAGQSEPTDWQVSVDDTSVVDDGSHDFITAKVSTEVGNTNGALLHVWDNITVLEPCEPCVPITASTVDPPTTMPSNGAFRLRDPVRPCNDLYVPICSTSTPPDCLPTSGIFFASMGTEAYDDNTLLLNPTNARRPIAISRQRRDKTSVVQLVTRTFADRDALLAINEPGSPLLLSGPPQYGIPDVYMSVGNLPIERGLSDHRFPVRINNMPFVAVDRPAGPSQGVCGSRVEDTCDIYDTWGELADAGLTFEDIVRGRASDDGGDADAYRTWDDVEAEFEIG